MRIKTEADRLLAMIREGRTMSAGQKVRLAVMLSVPAVVAQLSSIVMQYIDASMVGSLGAEASAAIGLVSTTTWLFAGLQIANIVAFDNDLRSRIDKAININEVCDVNPFGVAATIAAYNEGEEWLNQLVDYLHGNYEAMAEFCRREMPEFPITRLEGTYLVWMDCSSLGMPSDALEHALLEDARLWLNAGTMYGAEGEGYMRWNIACPRSVMLDGLNRFLNFVRSR